MAEEDVTLPLPKPPAPPDMASGANLTDSRIEELLADGVPGTIGRSSTRAWQPPLVEDLRRMLPQYDITGFLARGGMGAVYKGVQKSLDRAVAIKILPPDIEDNDAHYAERFKHEAKAMAKFKHPGIVSVYDAGETADGLLYFVMEFIEGADVAQLVAAHGKLDPEQALGITAHVCDALAYAHSRGVVHRDIKPSNIMIESDGTVKVADFGLAKTTTQESGGFTKTNMAMGTPDFIAPEAMITGVAVDQRADIYAVGVMLYQMLTGKIPRGRFELPSGIVPQIDPRLDAIVDKAMQTDRDKRYSTAIEMKADVERITQGTRSSGLLPPSQTSSQSSKNEAPSESAAAQAASAVVTSRGSLSRPLLLGAAVIVLSVVGWWITQQPKTSDKASDNRSEAGAPKLAGADGGKQPPAVPSWQKVPLPHHEALRFSPGAEVTAAGELVIPRTIFLSEINARNVAIRGELKRLSDASAGIKLRSSGKSDGVGLRMFGLLPTEVWLQLGVGDGKYPYLARTGYPASVDPAQWMPFEFAAIEDASLAMLGGVLLPAGRSPEGQKVGRIDLSGAQFRNLEYINLDGIPEAEALKLAGLEQAATPAK